MLPVRQSALAPPLDPRAPTSVVAAVTARAQDTPRRLPDETSREEKAPVQARDATGQAAAATMTTTTTTVAASLSSTDQIVTPPASDTSAGLEDPGPGAEAGAVMPDAAGSRKRMADGAVKGHSRTTSAVSTTSTSASTVAEMSAGIQAHLSYATFKLRNGWESRSFDEVESLASQALSPTSTASAAHRRYGSSASPHQPATMLVARSRLAHDPTAARRPSDSLSPSPSPGQSVLAPPAPIRPALSSLPGAGPNPRRNSNSRHTPAMLSRPVLASPRTPRPVPRPDVGQPPMSRAEQDVVESLLFMSSPGNSANLKHTTLPSASQQSVPSRAGAGRHALPSGPRKALPTQRPVAPGKAAAGMAPPPPDSPMDLDPPRQTRPSPNHVVARRRAGGAAGSSHVRAALSLPSGLGLGRVGTRKPLRDEDIERMLSRATDDPPDSSDDDEEIQLPRRDMAGVMGA
ncbi:hypothetical protein XA68_15956 [Ophiocordyceps unilateralis]|uniref:Uncharacterized protein n=1 Tax=Ophiocordyceps unilateralis TaxID=268505 RepID=A0A2A9P7K2_OPHUN|nr:hypothetical protein XA68_15956 [Ophiocordyceps unilateralis]